MQLICDAHLAPDVAYANGTAKNSAVKLTARARASLLASVSLTDSTAVSQPSTFGLSAASLCAGERTVFSAGEASKCAIIVCRASLRLSSATAPLDMSLGGTFAATRMPEQEQHGARRSQETTKSTRGRRDKGGQARRKGGRWRRWGGRNVD